MRLAISNIAWPPRDSERVLDLLTERGVRGLEIAPGLLFPEEEDPFVPSPAALRKALEHVRNRDIALVSMQSLHFGAQGAALFGAEDERARFTYSLTRAIDLAERLGIPNLVVGSPKNRVVPAEMPASEARRIAADVFRDLGDRAAARGCVLAVEPNPRDYGTNFLNGTSEAYAFVRHVDHPAVTLNFDVGALLLNGELGNAPAIFAGSRDRVSHVHLSAPHLAPVQEHEAQMMEVLSVLENGGWNGWVSIEMRAASPDPLEAIKMALTVCLEILRTDSHAAG